MIRANEAGWDRALRALFGIVLLYVTWAGITAGWLTEAAIGVGGVLLITGLVGWCPLYSILGVSTLHRTRAGDHG
jgi:hypothetical protein